MAKRKLSVKEGRHVVAMIGGVTIGLLTLFPPWHNYSPHLDVAVGSCGHSFIFSPPKNEDSYSVVRIDVLKLSLLWFIVLVLSGTAWFSMETILRLTGRLGDDEQPSAEP